MKANVQKDTTVLAKGEHIVCPSDALFPVKDEGGDQNWSGKYVERGEEDFQVV